MKHVLVRGLRLEYREVAATRPDNPTLALLHEGLGCVAMWRDFPDRLAAATGCRTVAWSRAGYGGSEPEMALRTRRYLHREAQEVLPTLLQALEIERPVLVGHSDGASIALIYAGMFPDEPAAVVAMSPHEFVEEETVAGLRAAREAWDTTDWRQRLARYHGDVERVFRDWNDTWLASEFRDWNIEEYLPKIACPVLAVQGEADEYATMRQVDAIAEQVPQAGVLKIPNCGHSPHRDRPEAVIAAVASLLGGVAGPDR